MSRVSAKAKSVQEWTEQLLDERANEARASARRAELKDRVRALEAKYGIASSNIHDAIEHGQLKETHEVTRWIMDYDVLRRIGER